MAQPKVSLIQKIRAFKTTAFIDNVQFCKRGSQLCGELEEIWASTNKKTEPEVLEAVRLLAPSLQNNKTPLFQALEFRSLLSGSSKKDLDFQTMGENLCETLINNSSPETESSILEAISVIEATLKEIQAPIISQKIEVPKLYFS